MILSGETIRRRGIITPLSERSLFNGKSYGLGPAGYDIRCDQELLVGRHEANKFQLASSMEHFTMPDDVMGLVKDKSTWARMGLSVFNTVIEPGWRGYLTLELANVGKEMLRIQRGEPIAQVVFFRVDRECEGYRGKYQDQPKRPVRARSEHTGYQGGFNIDW